MRSSERVVREAYEAVLDWNRKICDACGGIKAEFVKHLGLLFEDGDVPTAWEVARIRAEEETRNADHIDSAAEDGSEIDPVVEHPAIGTGGIEVDVRTEICQHESLAKKAGAEVGNDEAHQREMQCDRMQIERIRIMHVELAGEAKLLANSYADGAAMNEDAELVIGGDFENGHKARVGYRICVHGRKKTDGVEIRIPSGAFDTREGIGLGGVKHKVAVEAIGMGGHGDLNTFFIARQAGNQGCPLHVVAREFRGPTTGEWDGIGCWDFEIEQGCESFGIGGLFLLGQRGIKFVGEEVDVGVVDFEFAPGSLGHLL